MFDEVLMIITERSIGDVTILDLDGRMTIEDGTDQFRAVVSGLIRQGRASLVLNLRAVPYIDSTALGQIVRAYTSATRLGGGLKLLQVSARVQQLLVVTRLLSVFDVFDAEGEAVRSFGRPRVP
jgi:anti-sigma B factor antagonist